jgi:hypothetical protein
MFVRATRSTHFAVSALMKPPNCSGVLRLAVS